MMISSFLMEQRLPVPVHGLQALVRSRAKALNLRCSDRGNRPLLSDFAIDNCPPRWLKDLIPRIAEKRPRVFFALIDGAARTSGCSQEASTLALALLFEDVDACANYLREAMGKSIEHKPTEPRNRIPHDYWTSSAAVDLYIAHEGNARAMAAVLGIERSHLSRSLRAAGFPPGNLIRRATIRKALAEFFKGMEIGIASAQHGVDESALGALLRYNLYPIRTMFQ